MKSIRWVCTVIFALVAAGLVALGSARPARADAIVNPCTDAGLGTALASGGLITFNCGGPATITVTTDSRQINSTVVISGGNQITLAGSGISTFFWVRSPSGNLTLDGIRLTGAGSGGNTLFSDNILTVRNSAIYANASQLFFRGGSATLENTSIVSNTAGILADVNVTLRNVTILSNTPSSVYYARVGTTTLSNTVFSNANGNCNGTFASAGNNLSSDGSCNLNQPTDLPNTKSLLGTPVLGYATPLPGSLAIDGGVCAQTMDALAQARPGTGTAFCDIGAVEAQNVTVDLATQISVTPTVAMLGRPVTYTIVISNVGTGRVASFALTETLAPAFVNVVSKTITTALASLSPTGAADSVLTWAGANLRQGARLTVTLTGNGAVTLTQSALLTTTSAVYAPSDASTANDSASAAFLASFAPDLNLVKSTSAAPVMPGERVTYTIVYSNIGFDAATGWITDIVPITVTSPVATWTGPLTPVGGQTLAWTYGPLAAGSGGVITITGVLSAGLIGDNVFTNTVLSYTPGDLEPAGDKSAAPVNLSACFARAFDGVTDGVIRLRLQQAVDDASPGQLVKVAGTCVGQTTVAKSLTIRGGYALTQWVTADAATFPATLDAVLNGRVLALTSGTISVEDLALVNGRVNGADGAGLSVSSGVTATLLRARVTGNRGSGFNSDGGGIANSGTLVVSTTVVASNVVSGSSSGKGGGIFNNGGLTVLSSQVVSNVLFNTSSGQGGGIFNSGALTIVNTSILSNTNNSSSNRGGGLYTSGSVSMLNSTLAGNRADGFAHQGGAMYLESGSANLTNVTLAGNGVSGSSAVGGGIFRNGGTMTLTNTLLDNNNGGNCAGSVVSGGYNLSSDGSCSLGAPTDVVNTPGLLAPLSNGHRAPILGSLAVDAGTCLQSTDALGALRPGTGTPFCDIGAIETQGTSIDLGVAATAAPTRTIPGRAITWTIVISNSGTGRASVFSVSTVYGLGLIGVVSTTALPVGVALTPTSASGNTLVWVGAGLAQQGLLTITLSGTTPLTTSDATVIAVSTNIAAPGDGAPGNNSAGASVTVYTAPNLTLVKATEPAINLPGARITFTIAYTNSGLTPASGTIIDLVPVTLTQPTASWTGPLSQIGGPAFTWQLTSLAPGAGGVITVSGVISLGLGGDASFTNTVSSQITGDILPADDRSAARVTVQACYARAWDGIVDGPVRYTIQEALGDASPGQLVKVAGYCVGQMTVTRTVTIRGGYAITEWVTPNAALFPATLDAIQAGRVAAVTGGVVAIEDMALVNGRVIGLDGGGLSVSGGVTVTVLRGRIANNVAADYNGNGGGIANFGRLTLSNTQIVGNAVKDSYGGRGGGIFNAGALNVLSSQIASNSMPGTSAGLGGGIFSTGALTISSASVLSNVNSGSSNKGGGLFVAGALVMSNTTFAGNRADGFDNHGGAIYFDSGSGRLTNVTLAANGVSGFAADGGGLYRSTGMITLANTLLSGNDLGNCVGAPISGGYNLSSDTSCALLASTDITNTAAPMLPMVMGHLAPAPGNPAIDRGLCLLPADALGAPRPGAGSAICDIGAIEVQFVVKRAFIPATLR